MLSSEEIHLVDIVTQMDSHQSLAELATDNGVGAIIQKPLAPNLEVAAEIANYAKNSGTWLAVHENFRFGTSMSRRKDELEANVIAILDGREFLSGQIMTFMKVNRTSRHFRD